MKGERRGEARKGQTDWKDDDGDGDRRMMIEAVVERHGSRIASSGRRGMHCSCSRDGVINGPEPTKGRSTQQLEPLYRIVSVIISKLLYSDDRARCYVLCPLRCIPLGVEFSL